MRDAHLTNPLTTPPTPPHVINPMQGDPYKTLFVSRLSYEVTERKLRHEFEEFGPIARIRLVQDQGKGGLCVPRAGCWVCVRSWPASVAPLPHHSRTQALHTPASAPWILCFTFEGSTRFRALMQFCGGP